MTRTMRAGLVLGVASLALAGCSSCNPPPATVQCSDATVSFVTPAANASITGAFDVTIEAKLSDGTAFTFDGATLTIDDANPVTLAVSGSTATFSQVGASAGQHTLKATITKGACGPDATEPSNKIAAVTESVTIVAPCSPKVTGVTFPQDANADGKLNSTELPSGTDAHVRVAATCATGTQVRIKSGSDVVGQLTDIGTGTATVNVPVSADGTMNLFAELVKSGTAVNTTSSNPEALGSITIQRTPPTCSNTTKLLNGPFDDASSALADFQLNATGTAGDSTVTATFAVTGLNSQSVTPTQGAVSAQFTLPKTGDTTVTVTLTCTDAVGNSTSVANTVRLDFVAPTVAITAPVATPDGGPALVTISPENLVVSTNAEDGSQACASRVSGMTRTSVGCKAVSGGSATLPVQFSVDGTYGLDVVVTDLAGNDGTAAVSVVVQLSGCGLGFTRPSECPGLITSAQVSSGSYTFQTQSKTTCSGQPVALVYREAFADGGLGTTNPVGATTVGVNGLASVPGAVTSGSYVYSATVTNIGVDAGTTSADCAVTIDLEGPAISSPIVPVGQTFATINAAQDTQPGTPGAQRLLQFSARVPTGGRVDLCTTQAVDPANAQTRTTTPECGAGYYLQQSNVVSPSSAFTFSEGTYSIKIVVVGGGTTSSSSPMGLFVDVTRPCVLSSSRRLPQDVNSDSKLNLAELGSAAPQLEFAPDPACGDTGTSTLAATPVVIRHIVSGAASGSFALPADVTFAGGKFTANLTQGIIDETNYVFFVQLTDLAGNSSLYAGVADPSLFAVRIDKTPPVCDITSPSAAQTLLGASQVPGGNLGVSVQTAADVGSGGVVVNLSGFGSPQSATLTPAVPANLAATSFPVTGTHDWTVAATCTDQSGNSTAATSRALTIDLDPPTCSLSSPTNAVPYGVSQIQTTMTVGGAEGRPVMCTTDGNPLSPSFLVSGGVATQLLTYPNGTQTVACNVSDLAGNTCTSSVAGVVVNSTACTLNLTNAVINIHGTWFNRANTTLTGASSGTATVTANTSNCGAGKNVTLVRTGGTPTTTLATDSSGNVSFTGVALNDGETWSVSIDNGASVVTTQTFQVALVAPSAGAVTVNGAPISSGTPLFFVAAQGNHNVELGTTGYFADLNASSGAQFDLQVAGIGARVFSLDGTVELLFKGGVVVSQAVTANNQTISFTGTTLPHNDTGSFEVRLLDAAGNQSSPISSTATIDVIAPGAPGVTQNLVQARAATITLQWAPTYDDGADSTSGANAGYDVRWTTSSVPSNNAMAASTDYFGASSAVESLSAWSASTITRTLTLPPLNTYYIAVRALDEVGNYSLFTAPTPLSNMWSLVTLAMPTTSTDFGSTISASTSVVGDSLPDIVVASSSRGSVGSVYVYAGSTSIASQTICGTGCQELTPPDGLGTLFGSDLSTSGNVADDLTDATSVGVADVVVGERGFSANTGRVFIFLGTTGSTITKSVEIRGNASNANIGYSARIVSDLDGDGLDELAIGAYAYGPNRGRLYIFKGRSLASWQSLFVSGQTYLLVTSADWIIEADSVFPATPTNTTNGFGLKSPGLISLPGVTGGLRADGGVIPELVVPLSRANLSRVYLFSGATIASSTAAVPLTLSSGGADAGIQLLTQTPYASNSTVVGFGATAWGRGPVVGPGKADLFVSYPIQNTVFYYSNWTSSGAVSVSGTLAGSNTYGASLSAGDLNGDGRPDLLVSEGSSTANGAWLLYQKTSLGPFDTPVGGVNIRFQVSQFRVAAPGVTSKFGANSAVADIDGANGPDVILSDETSGVVRIWR